MITLWAFCRCEYHGHARRSFSKDHRSEDETRRLSRSPCRQGTAADIVYSLSVYGWVPKWLTITVISRDLIVTLGWFLLYLTSHITRVAPTVIGKAAIASQLLLIAYILVAINVLACRMRPVDCNADSRDSNYSLRTPVCISRINPE